MSSKIPLTQFFRQRCGLTNDQAIDKFIRTACGSHPGLALDRYLPFAVQDQQWQIDSKTKRPFFLNFVEEANKFYADAGAPWRAWARQRQGIIDDWKQMGRQVSFYDIEPRGRWIIGLGQETALETGITLHHIYAIPYIPGSALKGMTRAYFEREWGYSLNSADVYGLSDHEMQSIFGYGAENDAGARAGEVLFLDVLPVPEQDNAPLLAVDVMTPHFSGYYSSENSSAVALEQEDPKPIPFLAVDSGLYLVVLAARSCQTPPKLVKAAAELCRQALDNLGIGSKTAKGYGYFL